jgi:alpha-1,6-mannosyltransferase
MVFLAVAVITALLYAEWVVWVPLLPDNLYTPLLDLGKITGYRWSSAIVYLLILLSLYGLYAAGYWQLASRRVSIRTAAIFGAGALFCAELIWAYPATAVDVFGYIAHGRLLALHGVNPFIVAPDAFGGDAITPFLAFPNEPSQYGPIWILLGDAFASLARGDLLTEVLLYKLIAALAHLGGAAMVYLIAQRIADPRKAQLSAYLYLWNPLLLWEMVGNAHNDGVMMLFGLIGVWLFVARFDLLVLAGLAAGALVKLPIALIGPTLFVSLWRTRWARAVEGGLLAIALALAVYHPFWEGIQTLTVLQRTELFTASLGSVLRLALVPSLGAADASAVARTTSLSAFAIIAVVSFLFAIVAKQRRDVLISAYVVLLAALLLGTTWFQAWYVVWPFALGAALGEPRRHLEVALLSLGGLLQYFVFIYLWVIGVFPPGESVGVQSAAYLAIIGPLVVGLLVRSAPPLRGQFTLPIRSYPSSGEYH